MDKSQKTIKPRTNPLVILTGILLLLVSFDILFLILFGSEVQTYKFMQKEMRILDADRRIIAASNEITEKYKDQIEIISSVFPSEKSFPVFIQVLENELKSTVEQYQIKFSSSPIREGDKLFLLFSITAKTDLEKLLSFLSGMEKLPYMTHITAITAKSPGGMTASSEYVIGVKVYVQNPFNSK